MSTSNEPIISKLVYVGRRKFPNTKGLVAAFTDLENPSTSNLKTFANKKLSVPYPIGTVIAFERTDSGEWLILFGSTAKPEGIYHDLDIVRAWEIAAGVDAVAERQEKLLTKKGHLLDRHIEQINTAIANLPSFDRTSARAYVIAKIMGGS